MTMDLFDVLSNGERRIVLSVREYQQVYTWNGSLTLQCWDVIDSGQLKEVAIRTLPVPPMNFEYAVREGL